ncbi:hypothetical protein GTQ34_06900 [Muricauda sp. JGD-17]|uniref:Uncharacterized protein n=1 Tax=Flagellimonas ochracea TaxID=2696472 RepID=A0A964TB67_9FLAO|nr:hypothetical protein [Allomuricauda ochracea]NAY91640.1 hypothetical protein [Allomuricauda ochracea]
MTNELLEIEKGFEVKVPTCHGLFAWKFLRQKFYFETMRKKYEFNPSPRNRSKLQLAKNFFWGFGNLFNLSKFEYLFFNNADKRTLQVGNKHYDVFFDAWADKYGQEKSIFIEWAINRHFPSKSTYSKHAVSDLPFKLLSRVYSFFVSSNCKELQVFEDIKAEYGLHFNVEGELRAKMGEMYMYRRLLRWTKPKAVFLISSFTKMPLVVAAHLEGIPVIEAQHGFIGKNHQFYLSEHVFDDLYYPDKLIAFGSYEKSIKIPKLIFGPDKILPVGSLYLENVLDTIYNENLANLGKQYEKLFLVTLQCLKEKELLGWIERQALGNSDWGFILKPRDYSHMDYSKFTGIKNIMLFPTYSVYEILKHVDYNITIFSTVAIEAEAFGVKTIFFNLDGLSLKYFEPSSMNASVVNLKTPSLDKEHLDKTQNKASYFKMGYRQNVKNTELF